MSGETQPGLRARSTPITIAAKDVACPGLTRVLVQNGATTVIDAILRAGQNGSEAVTNRRA